MLISGPDPDWAKEQAARTANAINLFLNIQERHRTDRENERQRHMMLLAEHPELADGDYGKMILKKYGGDDPLSSMVSTIRARKQAEEDSLVGVKKYAQAIGDATGARDAEGRAIAGMDDTVPEFGHQGPGLFSFLPVPAPNLEKQKRAAAFEQLPDVTQEALERMSPKDRNDAMTYMMLNKVAIPPQFTKGFDRTQLPAGQQGLRAIGGSPAEQREAALVGVGAKMGKADIEKIGAEAAAKAAAEGDKRAYQEKQAADKLAQRKIERAADSAEKWALHSDTIAHQDARAEGGKGGPTPWEKGQRPKTESALGARMQQQVIEGDLGITINTQKGLRAIAMKILDKGRGAAGGKVAFDEVLKGYQAIQEARPKWTQTQVLDALEKQFNTQLGGK